MKYPLSTEYQTSVKYSDRFILDPVLSKGVPQQNQYGLFMFSGGYTRVFPMTVGKEKYALRCWIADVHEAEYRYQCINTYINSCKIEYFVPFEYVKKGILVNGKVFPILRMEWADGMVLKEFIQQNLNHSNLLKQAAREFLQMTKTLHENMIAHGDLQHDNIIVQQEANKVQFILIDYDSLFIPEFSNMKDHIVGLPSFQHPSRIKNAHQAKATEKLDYFSELVIYVSIMALAEHPELWNIFDLDTAEGLIFSQSDFEQPNQSKAFEQLDKLSRDVKIGLDILKSYCYQSDINVFIPIEQVIHGLDDSLEKMFTRMETFSSTIPSKKQLTPNVQNQKITQLVKNIQNYSPPDKTDQKRPERGVEQLIQNIQSI